MDAFEPRPGDRLRAGERRVQAALPPRERRRRWARFRGGCAGGVESGRSRRRSEVAWHSQYDPSESNTCKTWPGFGSSP